MLKGTATVTNVMAGYIEAHPLVLVLTSMPGVGFRTAIKILTIVGDGSAFETPAHLASYAGLAPVPSLSR